MKISIVIPNYNGQKLLEKHLPIIIKYSNNAEIIIVDDASSDNSVKFVKQYFPKIKIIEKLFNDGFASSVNIGVKAVTSDIFILLNSDILPKKGYISALLKHFRDPEVFAVGCKDESFEKGKVVFRGRGIGKFSLGLLTHKRGEIDKSNTLWVNGGSAAFRKSIWEKLRGMDILYNPFYWDDIDISYRAQKSGYKIIFEANSVVEHHHQQGAILNNYQIRDISIISYRNQFIFIWKNITDTNLLFEHFLYLPYHILKAFYRKDLAFIIGFVKAVIKFPEIFSHRLECKKLFKKTDQEVLDPFAN